MPERPSKPLEYDLGYGKLTDDQGREAYQNGDTETFNAWFQQKQEEADRDPSGLKRFQLSVDLARIQFGAGEYKQAAETISGANVAVQEELIELHRMGSRAYDRPDKEVYAAKLKELLDWINKLRNEIRAHLST